MILSENRWPLFGIMLPRRPLGFGRHDGAESRRPSAVLTGAKFASNDAVATGGGLSAIICRTWVRRSRMSPTAELTIRLGAFAGVFLAMTLWELLAPRRPWAVGRAARWPSNLGMVVVDALLVRLLIPVAAVGVALIASERGIGLFHLLDWPGWLAGILGFVVLDL